MKRTNIKDSDIEKETIKIVEDIEGRVIDGKLIDFAELNKIARNNCKGLTYLMNIMDVNSNKNTVYAWFKDDETETSYLIEI